MCCLYLCDERDLLNPGTAKVSGWGSVNRSHTADVLQVATISRKSAQECINFYGTDKITDNMICAGGKRDVCEGDSGGPLTCMTKSSELYLCGITSWGNTRCDKQFLAPGLYTDVSRYHHWITNHIQSQSWREGKARTLKNSMLIKRSIVFRNCEKPPVYSKSKKTV